MIELNHIITDHVLNNGKYFTMEGHITDPEIIKKAVHDLRQDPLIKDHGKVVGKVFDWKPDQSGLWVYIKIIE